jgi:hypothetical protein
MRKSAIGDFIDLLSSFVKNEQKARRKFCASYNAYWQWVKKICFIIDRLSSQVQQNQRKIYKALRGEYENQGVYGDDY